MHAAHVHMIIIFVLVATAPYRSIHRDMELLRPQGTMMNLRRIYESEKMKNLRRNFCLRRAPTKVFSSCDRRKTRHKSCSLVSVPKKQNLSLGLVSFLPFPSLRIVTGDARWISIVTFCLKAE